MSLLQQIKDASLEARKNKRGDASFLITLYAEAARIGKDKGQRISTDQEVIAVLKKFRDNAQIVINTAEQYPSDKARESAKQAALELATIDWFLPTMMTKDELEAVINGYIVSTPELTSKSMGVIMGMLKLDYPGKYDGAMASTLVKEALSALD